jgi:hypothetical protein
MAGVTEECEVGPGGGDESVEEADRCWRRRILRAEEGSPVMSERRVIAQYTVSIDGYSSGPGGPEHDSWLYEHVTS